MCNMRLYLPDVSAHHHSVQLLLAYCFDETLWSTSRPTDSVHKCWVSILSIWDRLWNIGFDDTVIVNDFFLYVLTQMILICRRLEYHILYQWLIFLHFVNFVFDVHNFSKWGRIFREVVLYNNYVNLTSFVTLSYPVCIVLSIISTKCHEVTKNIKMYTPVNEVKEIFWTRKSTPS